MIVLVLTGRVAFRREAPGTAFTAHAAINCQTALRSRSSRDTCCKPTLTTTTISREQFALAQGRVREAGLGNRVTLLLKDYRHLNGRFSKGVSIEMFEAVGLERYDDFFASWERLIEPGGRCSCRRLR